VTTLEATIEELTLQLNRANYIIGKASEGEASVGLPDDDDKPREGSEKPGIASANHTIMASSSKGFSKSRILKIDKNDEEVKAYLKTISGPSAKVKLAKYTQTQFDPLRMLIDGREKLAEMSYGHDLIKRGIDILLRLLGFNSLEDLLNNARKNAGGPHPQPGKPGDIQGKPKPGLQVPNPRDGKKKPSVEPIWYGSGGTSDSEESPEPREVHDQKLYPVMGGNKVKPVPGQGQKKPANTKSPNGKKQPNVSPPPDRFMQEDDDDYYRHQNVVKISPAPPNPNRYTEKQMQADFDDFRQGLGRPNDEPQDEYEVYLSKVKIEKELTLFRMYLNIKRR
jgi:hypothetical protein